MSNSLLVSYERRKIKYILTRDDKNCRILHKMDKKRMFLNFHGHKTAKDKLK